jgi:two-component system, OmpR family, alkaline phosphatase synthesis response regulator PhoP
MTGKHITLIEDEPDIQEIVAYNLKREGFQVNSAFTGEDGLALIERKRPDLILLDLMLPGIDGLEVCRRLRARSETRDVPIIIVSAKGEESDVVLGLGLGADDYISKPFSPREVIARVRAVLRRSQTKGNEVVGKDIITHGLLTIEPGKHKVTLNGEEIIFTASEFKMLSTLAVNPGRVFTREQLINQSLGENVVVVDRNIDVHIRAIRKKLGEQNNFIETIRGIGYRFKELDKKSLA